MKSVHDRVAELEEEFQTFKWKLETGGLKGEAVGASTSVTGLSGSASAFSGEFTGLSGGLKLWNYEYDIRAEREKAKLEHDLREREARLGARITEVDRRADRRLRDMNRDLNQKIRRKADRSAVGDANTRQNNQIRDLQRSASRAHDELQRLYGAVARLDGQF